MGRDFCWKFNCEEGFQSKVFPRDSGAMNLKDFKRDSFNNTKSLI